MPHCFDVHCYNGETLEFRLTPKQVDGYGSRRWRGSCVLNKLALAGAQPVASPPAGSGGVPSNSQFTQRTLLN